MEGDCTYVLRGGDRSKQALSTSIRNEMGSFIIGKPESAKWKGKDHSWCHSSHGHEERDTLQSCWEQSVHTFLESSFAVWTVLKVAIHFDSEFLPLEMHPVEVAKDRCSFICKDIH